MTKNELTQALKIAKSDTNLDPDTSIFMGFGLKEFKPVYVTLELVAMLIRYQCFYIFGDGIDSEALNEIAVFGRKRFMIV